MDDAWRLLIDPPLTGAHNMARDQALLDLFHETQQPTLRFYGWSPRCVSLGLAQRFRRDVDQIACQQLGIDIVRRPTGGRAILHDQEVTYAVVVGLDHPLVAQQSVVRSYRAISAALQAGLELLGVATAFEPEHVRRVHRRSTASAACFDQPSDYEIMVGRRKLIGSAQARQHGVLLQHGSLLLHADAARWTRVLRLPPTLDADTLRMHMIGLDEALGHQPSFDQIIDALVKGFQASWGIELNHGEPTPAEQRRTIELIEQKFANPAWTERR